jgi:hypothetical protein
MGMQLSDTQAIALLVAFFMVAQLVMALATARYADRAREARNAARRARDGAIRASVVRESPAAMKPGQHAICLESAKNSSELVGVAESMRLLMDLYKSCDARDEVHSLSAKVDLLGQKVEFLKNPDARFAVDPWEPKK